MKNNPNPTIAAKTPPEIYLVLDKKDSESERSGLNGIWFLAVFEAMLRNYLGSDASEIAETPASLAPSITLIIVSATAVSSA